MIQASNLRTLVAGKKVLVDSNIIVYLTDLIAPYQQLSKQLFQMVEEGDTEAVISVLSVGEVMQGSIKQENFALALEVKDYLINFPNCFCQEITLKVLDCVGNDKLVEWDRLRMVDSLILASGLVNGVDLFVSNDLHFKNALPHDKVVSFE